ncbi:hypothetical protein Tco_0891129 [Tanacetum coccineum]|uniref:Uncharacterized protein n=1 Tax=Tanacetum coccineum TaxID=301880 RepID=A0ABQ5C5A0_9ASTR
MSSSTHPITILSDSNVEDAFSSTNTPDYTPASPDYFPASPRNTPSDSSDDLTKYLLASLAISPFHDDPYMKVMQAYNTTNNESSIPLPQAHIAPSTVLPSISSGYTSVSFCGYIVECTWSIALLILAVGKLSNPKTLGFYTDDMKLLVIWRWLEEAELGA